MKFFTLLALAVSGTACYQRQDPVVRAAQDLQRMANDLVVYEEDRGRRFQSVQLGMSQGEVMKILGAPATQRLVPATRTNSAKSGRIELHCGHWAP